MADQTRNHPSRQQPLSDESLELRDPELERSSPAERRRSTREPASIAHDSGHRPDETGGRFEENRTPDELGSEAERETGISEFDDEDVNSRSDR